MIGNKHVLAGALAAALGMATLAGCASMSTGGTPASGSTGQTGSTTAAAGGATTAPAQSASAGSTGSTGGPTAAGVQQCATPNLVAAVHVVAGSQGMGHESLNITLTNVSGHPCSVYGFPGLQLMEQNSQGQPGADQTTKVTWDTGVPKTLVTLADSGSASTTAQIDIDVPGPGEPGTGPCEPVSYYMAIIPPNNTTATTARIGGANSTTGITACEHGEIQVLAFIAGTTGPNQ
jgi:Protein of unknown function (DUF4232)